MEGLAADFLYSHDADDDGSASAWLVLGLAGTYAFLLLLSLSAQKGIISRRHLAARSHQAHVFVRVGLKKKKEKPSAPFFSSSFSRQTSTRFRKLHRRLPNSGPPVFV